MTEESWAAALVFPIGHLVGAMGRSETTIRVGKRMVTLPLEGAFQVWGLAHGDEERVGIAPWTVADLRRSAETLVGIADVDRYLHELRAASLLEVVIPRSVEASQFARTYRLLPLQHGMAEPPRSAPPDRLFLAARPFGWPRAQLIEELYAIWQFAPMTSSLWQMAERFSQQAVEDGLDPAEASVDVVLNDLLQTLHVLLSQSAGYLDLAIPEASR